MSEKFFRWPRTKIESGEQAIAIARAETELANVLDELAGRLENARREGAKINLEALKEEIELKLQSTAMLATKYGFIKFAEYLSYGTVATGAASAFFGNILGLFNAGFFLSIAIYLRKEAKAVQEELEKRKSNK